jgi:hypothetical protein
MLLTRKYFKFLSTFLTACATNKLSEQGGAGDSKVQKKLKSMFGQKSIIVHNLPII